MLLVTREQREKAGDPAFVTRVVRHLKLHYFEEVCLLEDEVLRNRVVHCIERARRHGLTYEFCLTLFTANMLRVNPAYDEQPALARILADTSRPEEKRMEALVFEATPEDWDEAERQCDAEVYWKDVDALVTEED